MEITRADKSKANIQMYRLPSTGANKILFLYGPIDIGAFLKT
jgi:hypothetical protein